MSIQYDISTYNNRSFNLIVNWQTFSGASSGTAIPVNLTGYSVIMQCRQAAESPVSLFTVGTFPASGITLNYPSTGSISININPINYYNIGTGAFYYDVLAISPSGAQTVLLWGNFNLNAGVSQNLAIIPSPNIPNTVTVTNLIVSGNLTAGSITTSDAIITGGTIDGTAIGSNTPSVGNFTILSDSASANLTNVAITGTATAPTVALSSSANNIATTAFVKAWVAANSASGVAGVTSFNTRTGAVTLTSSDVTTALTYTPVNPAAAALTGTPTAPTAASGTNTTQIATTAFVQTAVAAAGASGVSGVSSFNTRTGAVTLTSGDVTTALSYTPVNPASAALTGTPTAPTAASGTNTTQIASTAYVYSLVNLGSILRKSLWLS